MNIYNNVNWVWTIKRRCLMILMLLNAWVHLAVSFINARDVYDTAKGGLDALEYIQPIMKNTHKYDDYYMFNYDYNSSLDHISDTANSVFIFGVISFIICSLILFIGWQYSVKVEGIAEARESEVAKGKFIFNKVYV